MMGEVSADAGPPLQQSGGPVRFVCGGWLTSRRGWKTIQALLGGSSVRYGYSVLSFLVLGALFAGAWWWLRIPRPVEQSAVTAPESVREILMLPTAPVTTTLVKPNHNGPPPWPYGNSMWLSRDPKESEEFFVVNMHTENFCHITSELKMKTVMVRRLGDKKCLVIDPLIPREWFRKRPPRGATPHDAIYDLHPTAFRPD